MARFFGKERNIFYIHGKGKGQVNGMDRQFGLKNGRLAGWFVGWLTGAGSVGCLLFSFVTSWMCSYIHISMVWFG